METSPVPAGAELCPGHPTLPEPADAGTENINALSCGSPLSLPGTETFLAPTALYSTGHFADCFSGKFGTSKVRGLMGLEANPLCVPRPSRATGSSSAWPWMCHIGEIFGDGGGPERTERGCSRASASSSYCEHRAAGRDLQGGGRAKVTSTCLLGGMGCRGALPIPEHRAHSGMSPAADPGCGKARGRADPASAWYPKVARWHPTTLPQHQPPQQAEPWGSWHCTGPRAVKDPERPRSGSGWGCEFGSGPSAGSRRKGGRSLLLASAGGSHAKVLDGLRRAPSPLTLPGDRPSWELPLFHSKQTSGRSAASPGCWSPTGVGWQSGTPCPHPPSLPRAEEPREGRAWSRRDAPRTPWASGASGRISCVGKGHRCPLARTAPSHGIFGKRLPGSPLPGPPVVISRGGSCCGCGSHVSLPALGRGNAVPGEITGNREAEGCGRINPG